MKSARFVVKCVYLLPQGGMIMPRGTNQKLKLYYLAKIMVEKTDW